MVVDVKSPKGLSVSETEVQVNFTPLPLPAHLTPFADTSPTIEPLAERRGSRLVSGWHKRQVHLWRAPTLMIVFFLLGFLFSVAHCIFYPKLYGRIVGNSDQQEEKIRFGTAFAFLTQILLGASVWTAYTQWLWRTVKRKTLTINAWNDAFSADTSVLSLFNLEMLRKLRVASIMACFAWSLLLPPFFTPATLFIRESTNIVDTVADMPYPAIALFNESRKFSYSPPGRRGTIQFSENDTSRFFTGPRTALNLITTATASLGEILPLDLPYNNSAYSVIFPAPIVRCEDAMPAQEQQISYFLQQGMETVLDSRKETASAYYAFVPTYNSSGQLTAVWHPRSQTPSRPLNELWMTFLRPEIAENGTRIKPRHYQVCKLHRATYNVSIAQYHGVQNVTGHYTVGEVVKYPEDHPDQPSDMVQHSYTAFMWSLCDQLVGKMAWFNETANLNSFYAAPQFGVIDSPIQRTSLLGSRDLDAFFEMDEESKLYDGPNDIFKFSDQRMKDKMLAKNGTLAKLIEDLSFNVTVGLMHNRLLTNMSSAPVQLTNDVNRYSYKPYGLFIPYILANIFSFVCICIGLVSCYHDGVLPGRKVQDIIYAARNPAIHRHASIDARKMSLIAKSDLNGDLELGIVVETETKSNLADVGENGAKNRSYSVPISPGIKVP